MHTVDNKASLIEMLWCRWTDAGRGFPGGIKTFFMETRKKMKSIKRQREGQTLDITQTEDISLIYMQATVWAVLLVFCFYALVLF